VSFVPSPESTARTSPPDRARSFASALQAVLAEAPSSVVAAWLFGSRARGDEGPGSDVDVALLFREPPEPRLGNEAHELEGRIEEALGLPAQVVVANDAPPDLVHRVLRDGTLLVDRDPLFRAHFETKARNDFFDVEPFLRRYREGRT
jgi:hypothetical protein